MADQLSPYLHRANRDGTFDSICIRCFVTVATAVTEFRLAEPESSHRCLPSSLSQRDRPQSKIKPNEIDTEL
jgi:hypothetical protein